MRLPATVRRKLTVERTHETVGRFPDPSLVTPSCKWCGRKFDTLRERRAHERATHRLD